MDSITIKLSGSLPSSLSKNGRRRSHWWTQKQDTQKMLDNCTMLIREATGNNLPKYDKADIEILSRYSNLPLDYDGLAPAVAPAIDAFVTLGIIEDDNPNIVLSYLMRFEKVSKRAFAETVVTLTNHKS
jgi:hypothetical protein